MRSPIFKITKDFLNDYSYRLGYSSDVINDFLVLSHQMGVFQWVWFKKSEHHSIMWEDFNRHRKKSNKILFEWWYFLSIFICIFYIGLSLFCEKILKCHFFLFFPAIFSPVSFNLLNGIQKKYYFYIHWNISIYKFKCVSIKYKI